jgi:hydrogenase-4 component E
MSAEFLWALVTLGFAIVVVRRRSLGIALMAVQSLLLGGLAISDAVDGSDSLPLAILILAARGILLPAALLLVVRGTRERRRVSSELLALPRLVIAAGAVAASAALVPPFGLIEPSAERTAIALLVLGIVIAAVRQAVVFQVVGFLVAENGVYLAGLAVEGGVPGAIELALVFDLVAVLAVAAAFGAKIHEHFGTSDTNLLRGLRD